MTLKEKPVAKVRAIPTVAFQALNQLTDILIHGVMPKKNKSNVQSGSNYHGDVAFCETHFGVDDELCVAMVMRMHLQP